jgi:hypothetical protein
MVQNPRPARHLAATAWSRLRRAVGRDRPWIAWLAVSFAFMLLASWQRWANPIVDVGREMNQPLRLAGGETLYSDVRHIYGPLSPWLHAALFRVLGPSLPVLYADGIVSAALVLALVYWLGRQIMGPAAAGAATLSVMSLCVFKPAGNYILPYSYNSLHGATLGLITLAILVTALKNARPPIDASLMPRGSPAAHRGSVEMARAAAHLPLPTTAPRSASTYTRGRAMVFLLAGVVAGLATLAKTEMGVAALASGVTAAMLAPYPDVRRGVWLAVTFAAAAASVTIGVYAIVAAGVGWPVLAGDSWLLLYNMPPELAYFNSQVSGLADPLKSIGRMLIAAAKLGAVAAIVAAVASIIGAAMPAPGLPGDTVDDEKLEAHGVAVSRPWRVLAAVVVLLILMSVTTGLDRDKGPYLAMPFLLVGFLLTLMVTVRRGPGVADAHTAMLITFTVYALASLPRMILHVRSGGAYASYLLPMSVVIFTYLWVGPFAGRFRDPRVARAARTIALALIAGAAVVNAGVLSYRYRTRNTVAIATTRGTIVAERDIGRAFNEALAYIDRHTKPGDAVAVMPEGTSLDFLSGRRNPLREEIVTPGYLDDAAEARAIRQLQDAHTALILIPNRPTAEFGRPAFGRDYCQRLMRWIEARYTPCAIFGPVKDPGLQIGDRPFFIRAYCLRDDAAESRASAGR